MEVRSQYADRYKKDLSVDNLRAKVARRKSITQKENRHKEFRRSRGLLLADVNVSLVREQELTVVEEMNESCHLKGQENKPANKGKTKEQMIKDERHAMLQRFKEEKQLRKLKEQREKASKGVFRCGIYKPETAFIPAFPTQTAAKVKQKVPAPNVTRVTRSTAKAESAASKTRTQAIPLTVQNKRAPIDRGVTKGRGQTSAIKKNESKVSTTSSTRTTRSAAQAISKLASDVKAPLKNTAVIKPQRKTVKEKSPEMVVDKTESLVTDQSSNDKVEEPEPILEEPEPILEEPEPILEEPEPILEEPEPILEEPEPILEEPEPILEEPEPILEDTRVETESLPKMLPIVHERKPSFAPQNFVFQPLDGLSIFNFQPMTPKRANAFLTPTFTWSPLDGKRNFVFTRDHNSQDHKPAPISLTESPVTTTEVKPEPELNVSPQDEVLECASHANSTPESNPIGTSPPSEPNAEDDKTTQPEQALHDVKYFRDILKSEILRLSILCSDWDKRIDIDIPEDAKDLIRTTIGQTRLLMNERFKQFESLVDNCEFKRGEKETTCTDLDGFWDMIYFQIEDVSKKFVNLGKMEENSWQQNTVHTKKIVRKKIASAPTVKPNQADVGRAAARSRLAAIKAAMKNKAKTEEPLAEVEAQVIPMQVDPVVFDAGFFRIESPAKLPASLRINRSCSETHTPKSTKKTVQNSATPINSVVEEAVEDLKPGKSPSPAKSPVRKALFGSPEESLQNQEPGPLMPHPECTETDSVPAVVDLAQYLVPAQMMCLGEEESPGLLRCLGIAASVMTQDGCDTEPDIESSVIDDVFMCSPEKIVQATEAASPSEPGPYDDVKASDPLDFIGSCNQTTVKHSPLRVTSGATLTDLITFSPMEN
ncbi:disks large-associated protein 5 isoform X2 [Eleutherodactylus coqui]|uniref:disks large-associated protein 5 isoform X2 n=1 Tax=Eleutherodactylus coqui TaxID=57060 RepID=UPI003462425F